MAQTLLNRSVALRLASERAVEALYAGVQVDQVLDEGLASFFGFGAKKQTGRMLRPEDGPIHPSYTHDATKIINRQQGAGGYEYWDSHNPEDLPFFKPTWAHAHESRHDITPARVGDVMDALKSRPPIGTRVQLQVADTPGHVLNGKYGTVVSYCAWEGSNKVGVELDGRYDPDGPSYWNPDDLVLVNESEVLESIKVGLDSTDHLYNLMSMHGWSRTGSTFSRRDYPYDFLRAEGGQVNHYESGRLIHSSSDLNDLHHHLTTVRFYRHRVYEDVVAEATRFLAEGAASIYYDMYNVNGVNNRIGLCPQCQEMRVKQGVCENCHYSEWENKWASER